MITHQFGYWRDIPLEAWMHAARDRRKVPGLFPDDAYLPDFDHFRIKMRSLVPVPHFHRSRTEVIVVLDKPGEQIKPHEHPEWTVLYYVAAPPHSVIKVDDVTHPVAPGMTIVLPPNTLHAVPPVESVPRISVAFRVYDHDHWTLSKRHG